MKKLWMLAVVAVVGTALCLAAELPQKPLEKKMKSITLPKVEFREASISDVIVFLNDMSRDLDPEKRGVNFVMRLPAAQSADSLPRVTLNLHQVPLYDVVRYTTAVAGLAFRVEENAVLVGPAEELVSKQMVTRGYRVSPGIVNQVIATTPTTPPVPGIPVP